MENPTQKPYILKRLAGLFCFTFLSISWFTWLSGLKGFLKVLALGLRGLEVQRELFCTSTKIVPEKRHHRKKTEDSAEPQHEGPNLLAPSS